MTDFITDESSVADSQPREFYEIVESASVTYRLASGVRDIDYGGNTFTASPAARTDIGVVTTSGDLALVLTLPLAHGLAQRWPAQGSPPRQVTVTVYRKQMTSGAVEILQTGQIISMAIERHLARFQLQPRLTRQLARRVCSFTSQRLCPWTLYDPNCKLSDAAFSITTTITDVNGRRIKVDGSDGRFGDESYAVGGDVRHVTTGERQLVLTESGVDVDGNVTIDMQAPIPDIHVGDSVVIRAGCKHDIPTCGDKFANLVHYGGDPEMPTADLFIPGNKLGVYGS